MGKKYAEEGHGNMRLLTKSYFRSNIAGFVARANCPVSVSVVVRFEKCRFEKWEICVSQLVRGHTYEGHDEEPAEVDRDPGFPYLQLLVDAHRVVQRGDDEAPENRDCEA